MASITLENLPEVFVSNSRLAPLVARELKRKRVRKIASRLYTKNLTELPEKLVKRHLWPIIAAFFPGALISDRTAIENVPAPDGSIFLISNKKSALKLPGITVKPRKGIGPIEGDLPFINGLYLCSPARAYLENVRVSRSRKGTRRTLSRHELEERLEILLQRNGIAALNSLREEMRQLAPCLALLAAFKELDELIGTLLGTKEATLLSEAARARTRQAPFDAARLDTFQILRDFLVGQAPNIRPSKRSDTVSNLAFYEAYFSNFIEGTEFPLDEAHEIIFEGKIPEDRPQDAHDILGTFRLVSSDEEMHKLPKSFDEFLSLLTSRHSAIMEGRPDKHPGQFKKIQNRYMFSCDRCSPTEREGQDVSPSGEDNSLRPLAEPLGETDCHSQPVGELRARVNMYPRAGVTYFVSPELVRGTLAKGFEIYQTLQEPFHRAVFMMFFVAEVHPFTDGNGRVARVMMNAELVSCSEMRIIIPTIFRNNYLVSLKAMSQSARPMPLVRTLDFAQKYASSIDWSSYEKSQILLEQTNAFLDPNIADLEGIRLILP